MSGKKTIVHLEAYRTEIEYREYSRCASIAFAESVNLPQTRDKSCDVFHHGVKWYTIIAKLLLLIDIIVNGPSQILPVQVVYGITVKYPFTLGYIIVTQFSCMLEYTIKDSPMNRDITTCAKIQCLRRKNLSDISRDLIRLLLLVIIRFTQSFRLIITIYQFTGLINIDLALYVLTCRSLQIIRSLQPIHSLQSDCRLPNGGFLLLTWLALTDVFIEVGVMLFDITHTECPLI